MTKNTKPRKKTEVGADNLNNSKKNKQSFLFKKNRRIRIWSSNGYNFFDVKGGSAKLNIKQVVR